MMQCFVIIGLIIIFWVVYGYSLVFDIIGMEKGVFNFNFFVGGLDKVFFSGFIVDGLIFVIVLFLESVFIIFQMIFVIIILVLIVGVFVECMKFLVMLIFMVVWFIVVYVLIVYMVWSGDGVLMWDWGVLDFVGGIVVYINVGIVGLVVCLVLGKCKGYLIMLMVLYNFGYILVGVVMLWIGWFGFNVGFVVVVNGIVGMVMLVIQIVIVVVVLVWMFVEWIIYGKLSVLGIVFGVVVGLVVIILVVGIVGLMGVLVIGLVFGVICFFVVISFKCVLKYDDFFDVFGVYVVGGIVGVLFIGIFVVLLLGGFGSVEDIGVQFFV